VLLAAPAAAAPRLSCCRGSSSSAGAGHHVCTTSRPAPQARCRASTGRAAPLAAIRWQDHAARLHLQTCSDPEGCPARLSGVRRAEGGDGARAELHGQGALRHASFDRRATTPELMSATAAAARSTRATACAGISSLPLGARAAGPRRGLRAGCARHAQRPELSHVLKVFLIDRGGDVRESTAPTSYTRKWC